MFLYKQIALLLILYYSTPAPAQHFFKERYYNCNTDRFTLERDSVTAKISHDTLLAVITQGLDKKLKNKIKGVLTLQIIVDLEGRSCLLSVKNDTNIKSRQLLLKEIIDSQLIWEKPPQKIGAVVMLTFNKNKIGVTRLGADATKGIHPLKE